MLQKGINHIKTTLFLNKKRNVFNILRATLDQGHIKILKIIVRVIREIKAFGGDIE